MSNFSIQSSLLVFDQVHRKTSTIERVCILTNHEPQKIDLTVEYDFPEHSWVQIYGAGATPGEELDAKVLTLHPGENRLLLSFNTDSFNFPDTRFKGRLSFVDKRDPASREWIEICFEEIRELKPFLGYAAIDIGTSSSTIALYHIQRDAVKRVPWTPELDGEGQTIPSVVFVRDLQKFLQNAEGGCLAGSEALGVYRSQLSKDPRCFQRSTKRLIGIPRLLITDEKSAGAYVDPVQVLHALGKHLRGKAQSHENVHSLINKVSVTYPPTWGYTQISRWKELFARLGFREEDLDFSLDEASAAGLFYIYNCVRERDYLNKLVQDLLSSEREVEEEGKRGKGYTLKLLCFDFGGGTIDLALIEANIEIFPKLLRLRLSLAGSDSMNFGGDQVTLAVFRILKRRLAMAIADPQRLQQELAGKEAPQAQPLVAAGSRTASQSGRLGFFDESSFFLLPESSARPTSSGPSTTSAEASEKVIRENWSYLASRLSEPWLDPLVEDAVEQLFPTRFLPSRTDPFRLDARRNFDWLWERAEMVKKRIFDEVTRLHGGKCFPSFEALEGIRSGISLCGASGALLERIPWAEEDACERTLVAAAEEVWQAIRGPLEEVVGKAQKLAGDLSIDRVLLSGQSCRMPIVRWLLSKPQGEGGLGIPPARIEFDEQNAKSGVAKGACLLHVMRETMVGFEIDVADFKAHLLADIFYLEADGTRKVLFEAGSLDDFTCFEESPDPRAFPRYLSIFYGTEQNLIGQFLFAEKGEALPAVPAARKVSGAGQKPKEMPGFRELLELREKDRSRYAAAVTELLRWSERERIAWMEQLAEPGSAAVPRYRYYLTRNHNLFAVRDGGPGAKRLYPLEGDDQVRFGLDPREDPFSGVH
jgi:molecular chaperone DnaK (HSP70)